ncbi:MAG: penicillin-binding protein [Actinobacteria bacterium]|nr:penicillin-binding protein [Actinomycetota bacterium]
MRRRRAFWVWMAALVAIAAGGVTAGVVALMGHTSSQTPTAVADRYLAAWQREDWPAMRRLVQSPPGELVATYQAMLADLGVTHARYTRGAVHESGSRASVPFHAALTLRSVGAFEYDGTLPVVHDTTGWKIRWSPDVVHPQLTEGARFATARVVPPRAPILAVDGSPLTTNTTTVDIGVEPRRVKDRLTLLATLQRDTGVSAATIAGRLDNPGVRPDAFVTVATVDEEQYQAVRDDLYPVPGIVFHRNPARVAATPELAQHVVGTVGPVTAELLKSLGAPYTSADVVGLSGLERTFERRLAGTPDVVVQIVPSDGSQPVELLRRPGVAPQPLRTTIDLRMQRAAEAALQNVVNPAAFVVVQPSTGQIRAVVSTPTTTEFNRAFQGQYPPGSTFKIITSATLLGAGAAPNTMTSCPATLDVGGRTFKNFEGEAQSRLSFATAFAQSCNTAFIQLGATVSNDQVAAMTRTFGYGSTFDLGVAAASGSFPTPSDQVEHAAAVIGQGRVLASPLEMTTVAAAVADGTWRSPSLVVDPPPTAPATNPLPLAVTNTLRTFMLGVVANGTGTSASVPGQPPVAGKTGTAEFGNAVPPKTHAWFVGYRGDLAFGVLVEGGGVGGRVAAPIAAKFLNGLG